jgi:hypothetical protein
MGKIGLKQKVNIGFILVGLFLLIMLIKWGVENMDKQ